MLLHPGTSVTVRRGHEQVNKITPALLLPVGSRKIFNGSGLVQFPAWELVFCSSQKEGGYSFEQLSSLVSFPFFCTYFYSNRTPSCKDPIPESHGSSFMIDRYRWFESIPFLVGWLVGRLVRATVSQ